MNLNQMLSKLRADNAISTKEYQKMKKSLQKKAVLVWSDGLQIGHLIFSATTSQEAVKEAREQIYKEYDARCAKKPADEECGAFRGEWDCMYAAEDVDFCSWCIIEV